MLPIMLDWVHKALCFGLFLYKWVLIAAILMTWIQADPYNKVVSWINRASKPLWFWCRKQLPDNFKYLDAYMALMVVVFVQVLLPNSVRSLDLLMHSSGADFSVFATQMAGHVMLGAAIVADSVLMFGIILLVVWFIITLVGSNAYNPVVQTISFLVEPMLNPVRRYVPAARIDLTPLVVLVALLAIDMIVVARASQYAQSLSFPVTPCLL